jgi:hypothetical protein
MMAGALLGVVDRSIRLGSVVAHALMWKRHNLLYRGSRDDIFVASFPKSGTTLVQALLYQMLTDGSTNFRHISSFSPALDQANIIARIGRGDTIDSLPQPHVFKTHLSYERTPKGPGRYIYVARHGLDVAVSYYHHLRRSGFQGEFLPYFRDFMKGRLPYGSWFTHVQRWFHNVDDVNLHVVTYESLRGDIATAASRLAAFCGVTVNAAEWPRILANCSFDAMRARESQYAVGSALDGVNPDDAHFIRRGEIGGWTAYIDSSMLADFLAQCRESFQDVRLPTEMHVEPAQLRL